jgi:glycosyltransferase involved in cell wall biosynthesis
VPYVCSIKGVLSEEARCERGLARLMLWGLSRLERLHARRSPRVLSTSAYCCDRITAHYGVAASRQAVVPEGIDPEIWRSDPPGSIHHSRHPFTVLCVAHQYARKRIKDLIAAFPLVLAQLPEARLVVIGDGPEHGALRQQVAELGVGSSVQLLGALASDQEVRAWYRRASIFCLPSIQEGFGIVFLEAMASGLPVVSTTATAIPEVVPDGRAGLLVPPRDPPALAAAMVALLRDAELQERCRAFGLEQAARFDWDRVASLFLAAAEQPGS